MTHDPHTTISPANGGALTNSITSRNDSVPPSVAVAWAPAKLASSPLKVAGISPAKVPHELLELAKQLELVEFQRQQLLARSPTSQRRPQSPSTAILIPLSPSKLISKPVPSLGLAPSLETSDLVVCDWCAAELPTATLLRRHKSSSCPQRVVFCPRAGCGVSFPAQDRPAHDRDECKATQRTQQLIDDHRIAHTLDPCSVCSAPVERRFMDDHKLFHCVKRLVTCQFEAFGCHDKFPLDERETHEASACRVARHRARVLAEAATVNDQIVCDWCNQHVLKRRLLDHQEEECPKRERPCTNAANGCPEWVPVELMDQHVHTTCVVTVERNAMAARAREMNESVVCKDCGSYVKRRYFSRHVSGECVSRIVKCKNAAHGCKARLRWRDRHLHEDFMALAMRERSMLHFPVGGRAYVVLNSETTAQIEKKAVDLPPPWTLELFLWMVSAKDEVLDLHAQCLEHQETIVVKTREHERHEKQVSTCKKRLKELKSLQKKDKDARSNSQLLNDVSNKAKELADTFNVAEQGVLETSQAIALAKGYIQMLVAEAHRILREEQAKNGTSPDEIKVAVAAQALAAIESKELLGLEFLSEDEQARLGDIETWAKAVQPQASGGGPSTAERKERAAEQRKLLGKRAEITQTIAELPQSVEGEEDDQETARLRRRYERELAKVEAKLALVSDNTPTVLLDRKGRHVIASSSKNAIVLSGAGHGQITYYRSVASSSKAARGEVNFQVGLARDRWHHIVFCAGKKELTLILNGEAKGVKRGVFELPFARLGSNDQQHGGESFQGWLQEARVWTSCLSIDYVRANADRIVDVTRNQGDLIGYYTFEEGMGDVVDDMALVQPRAPCFNTRWTLYNTPAIRQKFGLPPTPSPRDKTSCMVNQRLKLLAQRARDRETEPVACRLNCGLSFIVRELEKHQRMDCEHRLVVCSEPGCEEVFRLSERQKHLTTDCERATHRAALVKQYYDRESLEGCLLNCGATLKKRHTERHYTYECPNRLVTCPQSDCGESIVAKAMAEHLSKDCNSWELVAERKMVQNARKRQHDKLMGRHANGGLSQPELNQAREH